DRQGLAHARVVDVPKPDEDLTKRAERLLLRGERVIELLARDRPVPYEDVTQLRPLAERVQHRIELPLRDQALADENLAERDTLALHRLARECTRDLGASHETVLNEQFA